MKLTRNDDEFFKKWEARGLKLPRKVYPLSTEDGKLLVRTNTARVKLAEIIETDERLGVRFVDDILFKNDEERMAFLEGVCEQHGLLLGNDFTNNWWDFADNVPLDFTGEMRVAGRRVSWSGNVGRRWWDRQFLHKGEWWNFEVNYVLGDSRS